MWWQLAPNIMLGRTLSRKCIWSFLKLCHQYNEAWRICIAFRDDWREHLFCLSFPRSDLGFGNPKNIRVFVQTFDEVQRKCSAMQIGSLISPIAACKMPWSKQTPKGIIGKGLHTTITRPNKLFTKILPRSQDVGFQVNERPTNRSHFAKLHWTGNRKKHTHCVP